MTHKCTDEFVQHEEEKDNRDGTDKYADEFVQHEEEKDNGDGTDVQNEESPEEKEAWTLSKSKVILRQGSLNGTITEHMKPKEVLLMNPDEHGKWKCSNWSNNLRNLRKSIHRDRGRMESDVMSCGHDLAIVKALRAANPNPLKPKWRGSNAERLLKKDIDDDKHNQIDPSTGNKILPSKLRMSRPECQAFDLTVFRKHIHQEVDSRPKGDIRFECKKKAWKCPELHQDHPRVKQSDDEKGDETKKSSSKRKQNQSSW